MIKSEKHLLETRYLFGTQASVVQIHTYNQLIVSLNDMKGVTSDKLRVFSIFTSKKA